MSLVVTTRFNSMDLTREARKLEAAAVLEKPLDPQLLTHAVEAAAARPASGQLPAVAVIGTSPDGEILFAKGNRFPCRF